MSKPRKTNRKTPVEITPALREEFIKMRRSGAKLQAISDRFKVSGSAVQRVLTKAGVFKVPNISLAQKGKVSKKHTAVPYLGSPAELSDIDERIKELRERRFLIVSRSLLRHRLKAYCLKNDLNRADLKAVANELPLQRVSRKHREQKLEKKPTAQ